MFSILKPESPSVNDSGRVVIVLERSYDFLRRELENVFQGQSEVMVVVDRRYGERRRKKDFFSPERRNSDRRTSMVRIGSAIITV